MKKGSGRKLDLELLKQLYVEEKMSGEKIAKRLSCSSWKVYKGLKEAGLIVCDSNGRTLPVNDKSINESEIKELYLSGLNTHQIAKKLNMAQTTVVLYVNKLGITRPNPVGSNPLKVGDKRPTSDGYTAVYMPEHPNAVCTGFVLEHRLVMSEKLGRPLTDKEVVHHINENRKDNRPENLQLYSSPGIHNFEEHRHPRFIGYSNEYLLEHLRNVAKQIGHTPKRNDMIGGPHPDTYANHFGSWKKALELAGV